ncbi:site-specific integrase [Aeromonas salmonicida subsp. salmonicida]|nr:site-specific integrase [Aeromonas salmonicida subsp. salmonicida]
MSVESIITSNTIKIISYELKNWKYCESEAYVDEHGELTIRSSGEFQQIGPITLLYYVEFDDNSKVLFSEPIEAANVYLMYQKIRNDAKCISVTSRALKHFFSFLVNENVSRRQTNQPELHWDTMPIRESQRPTYRYRQCLKSCYHSDDPSIRLARSTCIAYLNRIVDFYKHYLKNHFHFENAPFQYELININVQNSHTYMQAQRRIQIHTTDLRLRLGKDRRKRPSPLTALAPYQWAALANILLNTRRVLTRRNGHLVLTKFPEEFSWIFLLMRWAGLRREEVLTLRTNLLFKPNTIQMNHGYVEIDIGPSTGVDTKFDKERTIEIPSQLMAMIYDYLQSTRYIRRRDKFIVQDAIQQNQINDSYLFINEKGKPYSLSTLNARWSDLRRTLEHPTIGLNEPFQHKAHNLRSTYAVERFINLLNHGVDEGKAFSHVQGHLGHERESTTWNYMHQAQDMRKGKRSPQEIWENVLDFHFEQGAFAPTGDK